MTSHDGAPRFTYRAWTVLLEGLGAGLVGGFSVMAVFYAYDLMAATPLQTPSALHAYFWEGPEAARVATPDPNRALGYGGLHVAVWIVIGVIASFGATLSGTSRRIWFLISAGALAAVAGLVALTPFWEIPGLGRHHLWVGACVGGVMLTLYLKRRHPHLLDRDSP